MLDLERFYIHDKADFEAMKKLVDNMFKTEKGFPEQVFKHQFNKFLYHSFYWTMSGDVWRQLQSLANESMDDYVLVAVLEPDPENYFRKEFKYYNWLKIPVNLSEDDYFDIIESFPKESPADAILYHSDVVIWFSPSGKWAIWGDRDWECGVIGFEGITNYKKLCPVLDSWFSLDDTLYQKFIDYYPQSFVQTFFSNYGGAK